MKRESFNWDRIWENWTLSSEKFIFNFEVLGLFVNWIPEISPHIIDFFLTNKSWSLLYLPVDPRRTKICDLKKQCDKNSFDKKMRNGPKRKKAANIKKRIIELSFFYFHFTSILTFRIALFIYVSSFFPSHVPQSSPRKNEKVRCVSINFYDE